MDITKVQNERVHQLNQLDELRQEALFHTEMMQEQREGWNDKFIKSNPFEEGDWTLFYYSRYKYFKGKWITIWLDPYQIDTCYPNHLVKIRTIDEDKIPLLIKRCRLRLYKKPMKKEEFIDKLQQNDLNIIGSPKDTQSI